MGVNRAVAVGKVKGSRTRSAPVDSVQADSDVGTKHAAKRPREERNKVFHMPVSFITNKCPSCNNEFVLLWVRGYTDEEDGRHTEWLLDADFEQSIGTEHGKGMFCPFCGKPFTDDKD